MRFIISKTAIALILTIVGFVYGAYANPYWKEIEGSEKYANGFVRALIGIPAWITYAGIILAWTIMGIPVNVYTKRVAEVGSQNAAMEVMGR